MRRIVYAWAPQLPHSPTSVTPSTDVKAAHVTRMAEIGARHTPCVEIDEGPGMGLFLDLGEVAAEDGIAQAHSLCDEIRTELGLSVRLGLASGKMTARAAARKGEAIVAHVPAGGERSFLADAPVETLAEMPPATHRRLRRAGFATLGQLAAASPRALVPYLGSCVGVCQALARGVDPRPVALWQSPACATAAALLRGGDGAGTWAPDVERLAGRLAGQLLVEGRAGCTVGVTLHVSGGRRLFAVTALAQATNRFEAIRSAAAQALASIYARLEMWSPAVVSTRGDVASRREDAPLSAATSPASPFPLRAEVIELAVRSLTAAGGTSVVLPRRRLSTTRPPARAETRSR